MKRYVVLLRGINVGGKNKVPMADLRACLEDLGFEDVTTYIASGNVLLRSSRGVRETGSLIERELPKRFRLDSDLVKVLVLTPAKLRAVVDERPSGFGDSPDTYHSDVIFLMDITPAKALEAFDPREGIDSVWAGRHVIYSQRLSAERTRSRLSKIAGTPQYAHFTIRNWNTTTKLVSLLDQ